MEKTKEEEYEALNQIRGILKDFDPESTCIGKAFEGCVELAKENIDNEWMFSENRDRDAARLDEILTKTTEKLRKSEEARVDLTKELNQKDDTIARLEDANRQFSKEIDQKDAECMDLRGKVWEAEALIGDLKQIIIELKAKLYDMMTREEVKE